MRIRQNPWKWPLITFLAVISLLACVFLIPSSWIDFFFSPLSLDFTAESKNRALWLEIQPPPEIEETKEPIETEPNLPKPEQNLEWENPAWWQDGWKIKTQLESNRALAPSARDSVGVVLAALGIGESLLTAVRPDSLLAVRLHMLKLEDSFKFDELKPYLRAMTRSDAMRDIQSRAADMYDDFLRQEIMVPD